jgi:tetratricopeptide (TPR) repeat protein
MRLVLYVLAAPALLLASCATPAATPKSPGEIGAADSAYGMFLAGSAALGEGRSVDATRFLDLARAQGATDPAIAERAFTAALLSGDIGRAAALTSAAADSEAVQRLGRLVNAVDALGAGKGKLAKEALGVEPIGYPHRGAAALLGPWIAAAAGDSEGALVRPQLRGDAGVDYFGQIGQAHLFERAKRFDEAETDFKSVTAGEGPSDLAVVAYGGFLERRNRRTEAIALYDAALARNSENLALRRARDRAAAGKRPPAAPTIREGAAFALLAPAATMASAKQNQIALAYLRLALHLDPDRHDAWLMLGDQLQQIGDVDGARMAYGRIKPGSPDYVAAQTKLAWSFQVAGDKAAALKVARVAAATGDADARRALGDLLRANEAFAEAADVYTALMAQTKEADWDLLFARGSAYERLGRWPEAETDLVAALRLRPDEPELLNYLGYAWIDRGERLKEAMAMVERAVAANPRSGAMVDSLGWAQYRLGDFTGAVATLEQAIELLAGDPEINNHLGDAYWMVGRKDEAVFQWRRVLTLKPDEKIRADAERKLASGLGPPPRLAGP